MIVSFRNVLDIILEIDAGQHVGTSSSPLIASQGIWWTTLQDFPVIYMTRTNDFKYLWLDQAEHCPTFTSLNKSDVSTTQWWVLQHSANMNYMSPSRLWSLISAFQSLSRKWLTRRKTQQLSNGSLNSVFRAKHEFSLEINTTISIMILPKTYCTAYIFPKFLDGTTTSMTIVQEPSNGCSTKEILVLMWFRGNRSLNGYKLMHQVTGCLVIQDPANWL